MKKIARVRVKAPTTIHKIGWGVGNSPEEAVLQDDIVGVIDYLDDWYNLGRPVCYFIWNADRYVATYGTYEVAE